MVCNRQGLYIGLHQAPSWRCLYWTDAPWYPDLWNRQSALSNHTDVRCPPYIVGTMMSHVEVSAIEEALRQQAREFGRMHIAIDTAEMLNSLRTNYECYDLFLQPQSFPLRERRLNTCPQWQMVFVFILPFSSLLGIFSVFFSSFFSSSFHTSSSSSNSTFTIRYPVIDSYHQPSSI